MSNAGCPFRMSMADIQHLTAIAAIQPRPKSEVIMESRRDRMLAACLSKVRRSHAIAFIAGVPNPFRTCRKR